MEVKSKRIPLAELPIGKQARIAEIHGGLNLSRRLLGLGLRIGTRIAIVQRRGHGVVVANDGGRVALGAGVADKLILEPID